MSSLFWKPGTVAPGVNIERGEEESVQPYAASVLPITDQRTLLPIYEHKLAFLALLEKHQVVIVVGQTGSGKTTQIPQYLDEVGWTTGPNRMVGCTQPRRVAATSVCQRVRSEMLASAPGTVAAVVGYSVRFDDDWTPGVTRLKFLTDGMLLREMMMDPLLSSYSVIMIDEAHERSVASDLLVALVKKLLQKRKDLRLIISSASVDALAFKEYYKGVAEGGVGILSVEGRMFPVEILFLDEPCRDYVRAAFETVVSINTMEASHGDILVFLTGQDEIETLVGLITELEGDRQKDSRAPRLYCLPLYAGLPSDQQSLVFDPAPPGSRKVIVATNIAESSVTIDGVVYVVDCGFVKVRAYDPLSGVDALVVVPLSKASATQRAGRAGRTRPGKAYRLYTEESFNALNNANVPEVQRTSLTNVVLQLKALGIDNIARFDFMAPPPAELVVRSVELLAALGALDQEGRLTDSVGVRLAEFPLDPLLTKALLSADEFGCTREIAAIAAMLSVQNVFVFPPSRRREAETHRRRFAVLEGDHATLLNVLAAFDANGRSAQWCEKYLVNYKALVRASAVRKQLFRYLERAGVALVSCSGVDGAHENIRKALVSGLFARAAKLMPDGTYRNVRDMRGANSVALSIHPNSVLFERAPEWVIYQEVVVTTKAFMRDVTVIEREWLRELAPDFYEQGKLPAH